MRVVSVANSITSEGEYYWSKLTLSGVAGVKTVNINSPPPDDGTFSVPNGFFDSI
jgi:hypothetical protein